MDSVSLWDGHYEEVLLVILSENLIFGFYKQIIDIYPVKLFKFGGWWYTIIFKLISLQFDNFK
jgi:hypothetical protein